MKLLKVLNPDLKSPYQDFQFEIGKKYHCEDFDESEQDCSSGFYATDIDGLPYAYNIHRKVFECEVSGKSKEFDIYKRRYENIELIREVKKEELIELAKPRDLILGYKLSEVISPINPLLIKRREVNNNEIKLLKQWASIGDSVGASVRDSVWDSVGASVGASVWASVRDSVWASVGASVRDSVWNSVGASVGASVWASVWDSVGDSIRDSVGASIGASIGASVWASIGASVRDSVWDSVGAYISSIFPNIKKWKYIEHKEGINPFQSGIDLWKAGLVPSYDGKTWRLHAGKDARIIYESRVKK